MGATMGKSGSNFLDALPSQGTLHVVMLGLDSAGKTTALYRLKFDQYLNTVPTIGFNCEKVQGTVGKARGIQFLVWDVGGQEKLRPLWRSYTRCTDGILFVVDSVDVERMEEAKMELMRTAKCPDNQGVPVLILANKQDLPGARDSKELEKLLGLHELLYPAAVNLTSMSSSSSSTGNIVGCSSSSGTTTNSSNTYNRSLTPTSQHNKSFGYGMAISNTSLTKELSIQFPAPLTSSVNTFSNTSLIDQNDPDICTTTTYLEQQQQQQQQQQQHTLQIQEATIELSSTSSVATTPTTAAAPASNSTTLLSKKLTSSPTSGTATTTTGPVQFKGWYIQPACAITGEGLQEGLEALYEMILKRRKLNKAYKKKR